MAKIERLKTEPQELLKALVDDGMINRFDNVGNGNSVLWVRSRFFTLSPRDQTVVLESLRQLLDSAIGSYELINVETGERIGTMQFYGFEPST